jgi:hypothetical protein
VEKYCTAGQSTDDKKGLHTACWIPKTTNTHSQYVILIAFPPLQRLYERASLLSYTKIQINCLLCTNITRIP